MTTPSDLIEAASLTEDEMRYFVLEREIGTAARDKALWAVVAKLLDSVGGLESIRSRGSSEYAAGIDYALVAVAHLIRNELISVGIEKQEGD